MENIKSKLKNIITDVMMPESENYLEELHELLENKTANQDDMDAIKDMEDFLVELQNILYAIEENKLTNSQAKQIYEKINNMLKEHQ